MNFNDIQYATVRAEPSQRVRGQLDTDMNLRVMRYSLVLPRGLFCLTNDDDPKSMTDSGIVGIRVEASPIHNGDVQVGGFRADGCLNSDQDVVLLRVLRDDVAIFVSIFQRPDCNEAPMHLRVQTLFSGHKHDSPHSLDTIQFTAHEIPPTNSLLVHVQTVGDVSGAFGEWVGTRGSKNWIEGFAIAAPAGLAPQDLSYQAILSPTWRSPEFSAGDYCGSRGVGLPLVGFLISLSPRARRDFKLRYHGSFTDSATIKSANSGEPCVCDTVNGCLEAIMVEVVAKSRRIKTDLGR
jgi:hypothetical protein